MAKESKITVYNILRLVVAVASATITTRYLGQHGRGTWWFSAVAGGIMGWTLFSWITKIPQLVVGGLVSCLFMLGHGK